MPIHSYFENDQIQSDKSALVPGRRWDFGHLGFISKLRLIG